MKITKQEIIAIFFTVLFEEFLRGIARFSTQFTNSIVLDRSYYFTIPISLLILISYFIITRYNKAKNFKIYREKDYAAREVLDALELYNKRIPPNERFVESDIVRWLKEDPKGKRDFFFIARIFDQVVGFTLIHYYKEFNFAFIAYLVSKKGVSFKNQNLTFAIFKEVTRYINKFGLKKSKALLFEVADPRHESSDIKYKNSVARIRHFTTIAEQTGFHVRAINIDYKQPHLYIPDKNEVGKEHSMLIMYAVKIMPEFLLKDDVENILNFIYNRLYPESFSEIQEEINLYKRYTNILFISQVSNLPEHINFLSLNQILKKTLF